MQLYTHIIDIRIYHPNIDPKNITSVFGVEPRTAWKNGELRKTPKGTLLQGTRNGSYWSSEPYTYGWQLSTDMELEDSLDELISFLEPHADFINSLCEKGFVKIWASSQSQRNYAIELTPSILGRISALGIFLIHDVYQGPS